MKKVIAILALVALTGNIASAELLKNFKANGSIEALGVSVNNNVDFDKNVNDKYGDTKTRVMINTSFDLNDDVAGHVSLNKANRNYAAGPETVTTVQPTLFFEQAYLHLKGVLGLDHKVGRQYYGNDGDIVIYYGPSNWYTRGLGATTVALDGWTANWAKDKLMIGAIVAKLVDPVAATNTDMNLNGITASYDYSEIVKPAAYVYDLKDMSNFVGTGVLMNNLKVAGVKATGKYAGFGYGAEYAMNMGSDHNLTATTNRDYKGTAMKFNADYGLDFMGKWSFMGEYASGSGDKVTTDASNKAFMDINSNYRPGLIAGGVGVTKVAFAPTSLTNLTVMNLGANWTPEKLNKLNLGLKYYTFSYTEKVGTISDIGTEADLVATWNHSENVALKLGLAAFMPDQEFAGGAGAKKDAVNLTSLYMNVKF